MQKGESGHYPLHIEALYYRGIRQDPTAWEVLMAIIFFWSLIEELGAESFFYLEDGCTGQGYWAFFNGRLGVGGFSLNTLHLRGFT